MGNLITSILGYDRILAVLLSASIVIIYCYWGGIKAVISTDIVQFVLMSFALVLVTVFGINALGGWESFTQAIPTSHFSPVSHFSGWEMGMIFISFLLGDALIPPVFQRLLLGKTSTVTSRSFMVAGLLLIPIALLSASHGLIAYAIDPSLSTDNITSFLFQRLLPLPIAIISLLGFFAVIISSADTYLNAAAGSFVKDVLDPLIKREFSDSEVLKIVKWATLFIGITSIFFAIAVEDILDILLKTYQFWGPTLVVPLLGIIFNKRVPLWGFYASLISGGTIVVIWNYFQLESVLYISTLLAGLLGNLFIYSLCYGIAKECCDQSVFEPV